MMHGGEDKMRLPLCASPGAKARNGKCFDTMTPGWRHRLGAGTKRRSIRMSRQKPESLGLGTHFPPSPTSGQQQPRSHRPRVTANHTATTFSASITLWIVCANPSTTLSLTPYRVSLNNSVPSPHHHDGASVPPPPAHPRLRRATPPRSQHLPTKAEPPTLDTHHGRRTSLPHDAPHPRHPHGPHRALRLLQARDDNGGGRRRRVPARRHPGAGRARGAHQGVDGRARDANVSARG